MSRLWRDRGVSICHDVVWGESGIRWMEGVMQSMYYIGGEG